MMDAGVDAPSMPDAPQSGGTQTLSQTTSTTADGMSSFACGDGSTYTARTSYYRVFPLSTYGITGAFNVSEVDFPVQNASNGPKLKVTVGTYSGTIGNTLPGTITAIQTATVNPADGDTSESVPITATIPAGSNLVVEIDQTNEGTSTNKIEFYVGANTDGEMPVGYITSPAADCNVTTPTSVTQEAGTETDLIFTVTGSS